MTWLLALNKILDIKLVQYALLTLLVGSLGYNAYLKISKSILNKKYVSAQAAMKTCEANTLLQNTYVASLEAKYKKVGDSITQASKIAADSRTQSEKRIISISQTKVSDKCEDSLQWLVSQGQSASVDVNRK